MKLNLVLFAVLFIAIFCAFIIYILRKGRINIKYALVWFLALIVLTLLLIFPGLFSWLTKLFGFNLGSNMIFAGLIGMLMIINIVLTVIVSGQNEKVRLLIQEVSILKKRSTHE